jgi:hypothetical protein
VRWQHALGLVLAAVLVGFLVRVERIESREMLPLALSHRDHADVNCITCHHEFTDGNVGRPCFQCHKVDPRLDHRVQEDFHDLCRGCHVERQLAGEPGGPTRACGDCHVADDEP